MLTSATLVSSLWHKLGTFFQHMRLSPDFVETLPIHCFWPVWKAAFAEFMYAYRLLKIRGNASRNWAQHK